MYLDGVMIDDLKVHKGIVSTGGRVIVNIRFEDVDAKILVMRMSLKDYQKQS